jgi:hypothetical protein
MKPLLDEKFLDETLVKCMSVQDVKSLADICSKESDVLEWIVRLALDGNDTKAAKAAWVLSKSAEVFKSDINPFTEKIIDRLHKPATSGIKRELLKTLLFSDVHQSTDTRLLDLILALPFSNDDVGVKYIALRHLEKYAKNQPELKQEIVSTLELSKSGNPTLWARHAKRLIDRLESKKRLNRNVNQLK